MLATGDVTFLIAEAGGNALIDHLDDAVREDDAALMLLECHGGTTSRKTLSGADVGQ